MNSLHLPLALTLTAMVCIGILPVSYGQDTTALSSPPRPAHTQTVFVELVGSGLFYSVNYDTRLTKRPDGLGIRAGLGTNFSHDPFFLTLPVGLNYLLGKNGNYLEMGAALTYLNVRDTNGFAYFGYGDKSFNKDQTSLLFETVNVGYRRQPLRGGPDLRIGLSPIFGEGISRLSGYLSLGYSF